MKNYAKNMLISCTVVLVVIFIGIFYFLYDFRFGPEYFIYTGAALIVAFSGLVGGSVSALAASIFAIILYAGTYFYSAIRSASYFDITYTQGLWLALYLFIALVIGKVGDGIGIYMELHRKYPREMQDLMQDFAFHVVSQKSFNEFVDNEIARSRRMQTNFCLAVITLQNVEDVTRVFGEEGIYKIMEKIKFCLRTIFRKTDRITKITSTTLEMLFPELKRDTLMERLIHLQLQLENSYLEHGGASIKFPIGILVNTAQFPQDGEDVSKLRAEVEKKFGRRV